MDFPVLHDPGSIEMLLRTVSKTDPPKAVDREYLHELGFKREMDEGLLHLLDFLDFIDKHGHPTVNWVNYNNQDADSVLLRESIRKAYHGLFEQYPEAWELEGTQLMEYFKSEGASENNAAYMILTFKVLCDLSGMDGEESGEQPAAKKKEKVSPPPEIEEVEEEEVEEPEEEPELLTAEPMDTPGPVLRVSLNIDLDQDSDPELRDLVMKLIRKRLEL